MPNRKKKLTFGVKQTEKINKAVNEVNETPKDFIKKSAKLYLEEYGTELLELAKGL